MFVKMIDIGVNEDFALNDFLFLFFPLFLHCLWNNLSILFKFDGKSLDFWEELWTILQNSEHFLINGSAMQF